MRCVSVTLLLCLATVLLAQVTCQISGRSKCLCLKTSDRVLRKENIESYMMQRAGTCHIDAVLFKTVKSRFICSDPQSSWAIEAMRYVDKKKKATETTGRPVNSASTSKTASMLNTTSNWNTAG